MELFLLQGLTWYRPDVNDIFIKVLEFIKFRMSFPQHFNFNLDKEYQG